MAKIGIKQEDIVAFERSEMIGLKCVKCGQLKFVTQLKDYFSIWDCTDVDCPSCEVPMVRYK